MGEERKGWLDKLADKICKEEAPQATLVVEEAGFAFVWPNNRSPVRWSEVKEIFAFKRDLWGYDLICIGFRISDDGEYWEIDEQMPGYKEVIAAVEKAFPGIETEWWRKVAFPAFKMNFMTLWGQPKIAAIWQLEPGHLAPSG